MPKYAQICPNILFKKLYQLYPTISNSIRLLIYLKLIHTDTSGTSRWCVTPSPFLMNPLGPHDGGMGAPDICRGQISPLKPKINSLCWNSLRTHVSFRWCGSIAIGHAIAYREAHWRYDSTWSTKGHCQEPPRFLAVGLMLDGLFAILVTLHISGQHVTSD